MRRIVALTCVALACVALAWARPARAQHHDHHGLPERIGKAQRVGPYVVSVWTTPDVGMAMLYVVFKAPDGATFVAPSTVRVGLAPALGGRPEVLYDAHAEPVRRGARFVAGVTFDRSAQWRVRVITTGPIGGGEMHAQLQVAPTDMGGSMTLVFFAIPCVAIVGLWHRSAMTKRRAAPYRRILTSP